MFSRRLIFLIIFGISCWPVTSLAVNQPELSVWVPYWKKTAATKEVLANLDKITTISPFSYEVVETGLIKDVMKLDQAPWVELFASARAEQIKIVPTIMWSDGAAIKEMLSTQKSRRAQIKDLSDLVKKYDFDGLDLDYENKPAAVWRTFSAFLRDLSKEMHRQGKILSCTIEPRLPPDSRFLVVPAKLEYANDYKALNQYCDEVRIMTYGQMTADILLNRQKMPLGFYAPVADLEFVKKVIDLAREEISSEKLVIGLANFGYEYEVIDQRTYDEYKFLRSLSYETFNELARQTGVLAQRNNAGELSFSYQKFDPLTATTKTYFAVLSDKVAIASKVDLAQKLGLKGVSLFKVDGESETDLWSIFAP